MPIQFVGPGVSLVGRAIPVLQNLAGSAALGGLTSVVGTQLLKPKPTGKEKLSQAWGKIPENLFSAKGGSFGYMKSNDQPSYNDAQGNVYDAVSGRLLYPAKVRPGGGGGGGGGGNAGYSDPGFRPFGGTPGERAQAAETSRVAQLTAQDPELQRYEAARLKAVAPGATAEQVQSAEDIGMQMWAKANPTLAAKVKAGQSGYEAIQGTLAGNMARAGQGFGIAEQLVPTPQGFPTQVPGLPTGTGYSTGFGVTSNLAPGAQTPPPYSTIKPTSELSGLGAAPLGTATTSVFGQPNVMDAAKFEELLKLVKK
jgi:hypothetical protein